MRGIVRVALLLGMAGWTLGGMCSPSLLGPVTPTDGSVIGTFSFGISIEVKPSADPSTLLVTLNGGIWADAAGGADSRTCDIRGSGAAKPGAHVLRAPAGAGEQRHFRGDAAACSRR